MSDLKSTTFKSGWFTTRNITSIANAIQYTKGAGADERLRILTLLDEAVQEIAKRDGSFKFIDYDVSIKNSALKAWAVGIIAGWTSGSIEDTKCHQLMLAAKALRCWEMVKKALPVVDDEGFSADEEEVVEAFEPDEAAG